ncbi:unnamed protein product [Schistocephalus solidus]|uniref:Uncharacterized protein n=1 Tax=Schistocephalus solidus TaxID=70667 RepID=A0A183S873_SCHSO|nr:unnamed protein product [Schistocephalus solidus]
MTTTTDTTSLVLLTAETTSDILLSASFTTITILITTIISNEYSIPPWRSHIHLTHRPDRLIGNPSHGDCQTSS